MKKYLHLYSLFGCIFLVFLVVLIHKPVEALSRLNPADSIDEAAMRLVQFCADPKTGLDEKSVAVLVDFVLNTKQNKEYALSKLMECTGVLGISEIRLIVPFET